MVCVCVLHMEYYGEVMGSRRLCVSMILARMIYLF